MTVGTTTKSYDAVIVGARCAGAATALLLSARGARVLVVDHDQPGTDTMSTHALMRGAVMQLGKWGVLDAIIGAGTPPVRRTSFIYAGSAAVDVDIKPDHGVDALFAPRRRLLDATLAEAASAAGAEFRYATGCAGLVFDAAGRVRGVRLRSARGAIEEVRAGVVIGADGRRSAVARHVAAPVTREARHSIGCIYRYMHGVPDRGYRWHFAQRAAGGIIPTNDGLSCVFVAVPPDILTEARAAGTATQGALIARHLPVLAAEIEGAIPTEGPVTFAGARGYLRQSAGEGWALVGDAGYFRDPLTAHGITDALRDAEILADAIVTGCLSDYTALRNRLSSDFFDLTDRIAALDWSMDEIQDLHRALNRVMKANQDWIAGRGGLLGRAARLETIETRGGPPRQRPETAGRQGDATPGCRVPPGSPGAASEGAPPNAPHGHRDRPDRTTEARGHRADLALAATRREADPTRTPGRRLQHRRRNAPCSRRSTQHLKDSAMNNAHPSILGTIGNTPIVKINKLAPAGVELFVKLEAFNPMGSVKDRLALGIIEAAERDGSLKPGQTVIEATSGNTGIGLAMVCAAKGYPLVVTMAESFSVERRKLMRFLGAKVILTPAAEKGSGMLAKASELAEKHGWFLARQFENEAGPDIHSRTTAREILDAFADVPLDYWVSGFGTGGTMKGVARVLKAESAATRIIAAEPDNAPLLGSGIAQAFAEDGSPAASHPAFRPHLMQGWTPDFIPRLAADVIEAGHIDEIQPVHGNMALEAARALARHEGILCGISGGATFAAALEVARRAPKGSRILAMLPDTGERYLSTPLFSGIAEAMNEEEGAIAASTPRFRFDTVAAPVPPVSVAVAPGPSPEAIHHVDEILADADRPVVMFALEWCEFSWSVRKLFAAAGIPYRSVDLDGPEYRENDWGGEVRRALARRTGAATIPQIFVAGDYIGGAGETLDAFDSGALQQRLAAAGHPAGNAGIPSARRFLPGWVHPRKPAAA